MNNRTGKFLINAVAVGVFVLSAYLLFVGLSPYEPYQFIDFIPPQEAVCTNAPVTILANRYIDREANINNVFKTGFWKESESGAIVGDVSAALDKNAESNDDTPLPSPAFKVAPLMEGEWYPNAFIEVRGSILGWPRVQRLQVSGTVPMTVIECGAEEGNNGKNGGE